MRATKAHQCCQALVAKAACSVSQQLRSLPLDIPGEPTLLALGRKAYVSLVLKSHQNIQGGKQKVRKWEQKLTNYGVQIKR